MGLVIERSTAWTLGGLLLGLLVVGCSAPSTFQCEVDAQCQLDGQLGQCAADGFCAFEDEDCESGWAYGKLADPSVAGTCVPVSDGSDGTAGPLTGSTSTSTTSTTSTTGPGDDTGTEPGCPEGAACQPTDSCALAGICDAVGNCTATEWVQCERVSRPCATATGECTPDGECEYVWSSPETPCEDGDPCTVDDYCDGNGGCQPGTVCPTTNPCQVGSCTPRGCELTDLEDGESCGSDPADRCCGGECVDISQDDDHCGGCSVSCGSGERCDSIELTQNCSSADPDTSGRCSCGESNDCPNGQTCTNDDPYPGFCEPVEASACPGNVEVLMNCPNYCAY